MTSADGKLRQQAPVKVVDGRATYTVPAQSVTSFAVKGVSGVAKNAGLFTKGHSYTLTGVQSGKAVTVAANGTSLVIGAANSTVAQEWQLDARHGKTGNRQRYVFANPAEGKRLAVRDGVPVVEPDTGERDPATEWIMSTTGDGTWTLVNAGTGRVLEVGGQATNEGAARHDLAAQLRREPALDGHRRDRRGGGPLGGVSKVASSARRAGPAASGACDRKAEGRPDTGCIGAIPTTRRACVPDAAGQTGLSKHPLGPPRQPSDRSSAVPPPTRHGRALAVAPFEWCVPGHGRTVGTVGAGGHGDERRGAKMRAHGVTKAATLLAALALAAVMGTASATPEKAPQTAPGGARRAAATVLVDCLWKAHVRPARFLLACGDGNSRLTSLRWSRWDRHAAVARGRNLVNGCDPYCAAGTFHAYPVVVRLDRAERWAGHPGLRHYTRMTLTYPDGRPERLAPVVTYPLWS